MDLDHDSALIPSKGVIPKNLESYKKFVTDKLPSMSENRHKGQRKLFMSELDFLTRVDYHDDAKYMVIYAGSAPGIKNPLLIEMFSFIDKWIFVDPAKFSEAMIKYATMYPEDVTVMNKYFTDELAEELYKEYHGKFMILFISDVRRDNDVVTIEEDMRFQESWVKHLKPAGYMLKFRLPYIFDDAWNIRKTIVGTKDKHTYRYLAGDIVEQPWRKIYSAESRLIMTNKKISYKVYDPFFYDFYMSMVMTKKRYAYHENGINWDQKLELEFLFRFFMGNPDFDLMETLHFLESKKIYFLKNLDKIYSWDKKLSKHENQALEASFIFSNNVPFFK